MVSLLNCRVIAASQMTEAPATVFVVDDDQAVSKSLARALRNRGFTVQTFDSAQQFLEQHLHDTPGCLVLDLDMPGMTGLELQKALIKTKRDIPIIFISGHGDIPQSVQAIKGGALDFIEKPIKISKLLTLIDEAMATDANRRSARLEREQIRERFAELTEREFEVMLLLIADGGTRSSKHIARELAVSHRTIDHHRARIMQKTNARSVAELSRMAALAGISAS